MFTTYKEHVRSTDIINQAGRQRMYSQKIAKLILYVQNGDLFAIQELQETVQRWGITHRSFMDENSPLSKFYFSNPSIKENFEELSVSQEAIEIAVSNMVAHPETNHAANIAIVMEHERRFLVLMDTIVEQMKTESDQSFFKATISELIIGIVTFLGITTTIFLFLIPAVNNLRMKDELLTSSINEKEALLAEIHHRVKNNLAVVSGIFQLQLMNKEYNSESFENAINRVQSIASIHEFLYNEQEYSSVKIDQFIHELIDKLSDSHPKLGNQIKVNVLSDSIDFDTEKTVPFSLLINELITNSLKHAFREGDLGEINITLTKYDEERVYFKYQDNGRGATFSVKEDKGIGMRLINALADQLESELEISFSPSFILTATFEV